MERIGLQRVASLHCTSLLMSYGAQFYRNPSVPNQYLQYPLIVHFVTWPLVTVPLVFTHHNFRYYLIAVNAYVSLSRFIDYLGIRIEYEKKERKNIIR